MSELLWGRYCKVCGLHHTELYTLGKLQCSYHPLPLNLMGRSIEDTIQNGKDKYGHTTTDKYPVGCFECCGSSPIATLPNGKRNPYFDTTKLNGCTRKDHSGIQSVFTDYDDIPMSSWPELLRAEMDDDIQRLLHWTDGPLNLRHKGLYATAEGEIFIRRYDKEKEEQIKCQNKTRE